MNKKQFDVLVHLERNMNNSINIEKVAENLGETIESVNDSVVFLIREGLLVERTLKVTDKGYRILEPHKVSRAIFIAAGFGSRLVPITYNTPKPLIRVNGVRMIDTMIDAILEAGIEEIIIVRGYLKEQFDTLLPKYPMLKFIDNDYYNEANNISSAYLVKDLYENAIVLEADLIVSDKNIIRKYEYCTSYRTIQVDETEDWCFDTKGDLVTSVKIGGENTHQMIGISFWTKDDAKQLSQDLERAYKGPGGKELFWDEVALKKHSENYEIRTHNIQEGSIVEIDTFAELCEIDPIYKIN